MVPIFLAALVLVRGVPALLYRRALDGKRTAVAGLLQATSLPFIVASTAIGVDLGLLSGAEAAALVGAGLLSVLFLPVTASRCCGAASGPSRRMGPLESAAPRPFRRCSAHGRPHALPDERGPRVARQPESQATPRRSTSQRSLGRTVSTVP